MSEANDGASAIWFEGYQLPAFLTAEDIQTILSGIVERRTVVRWFASGRLQGFRPGRRWVIRASQFVEDWAALERGEPGLRDARARRLRVPQTGVINVALKDRDTRAPRPRR